jgi:hypothetical protein
MKSLHYKIDEVEADCVKDLIKLAGVEIEDGSSEEIYKRSALDMKKRGYVLNRDIKISGVVMVIAFGLFKDEEFIEGRLIELTPSAMENCFELNIGVVVVDKELYKKFMDYEPKKEGKVRNFSKYN